MTEQEARQKAIEKAQREMMSRSPDWGKMFGLSLVLLMLACWWLMVAVALYKCLRD